MRFVRWSFLRETVLRWCRAGLQIPVTTGGFELRISYIRSSYLPTVPSTETVLLCERSLLLVFVGFGTLPENLKSIDKQLQIRGFVSFIFWSKFYFFGLEDCFKRYLLSTNHDVWHCYPATLKRLPAALCAHISQLLQPT